MSRIGKKPIVLPSGVTVQISQLADHEVINLKGSKGTLSVALPVGIKASNTEQQLTFSLLGDESKNNRALWGLARSLVNNAVKGVTDSFSKTLEINGVGFKAAMQGKKLILNVGFSHPVEYNPSAGINISVDKNQIIISGIDKQIVGQTAAEIRHIKKPESYKGKGIKYQDELIRRKAGKVVKA
ncbi:MAG: 50S ribosomal protein L6 [Patescibacteria group bacterium]